MIKILVLVCLFISLKSSANPSFDENQLSELAQHPKWLKLMHYKKRFSIWGYVSELDGKDFFFAKDGKTNPLGELKANIQKMKENIKVGRMKQHPQCAFPERYRFLKKHLGLKYEEPSCPKLEQFLKRFDAESVALVFSTAYPNNPGSMFGHTFLRINSRKKKGKKKHFDLLDNGLSFAASVPPNQEGGALYATLGLFGGYRGQFSLIPYYVKVNDYNNSESRDLWEYDLNLNREETLSLLRHTWEIETNSHFQYYFFDENCAYHLLSLIELAKPEWQLTSNAWFVLPSDTIKALVNTPGAVRNIHFRPSLRKKMYQSVDAMSDQQKKSFKSILVSDSTEPIQHLSDPFVLDNLSTYFSYLKRNEKDQFSKTNKEKFDAILRKRSQIPSTYQKPELAPFDKDNQPELGHSMSKIGLSYGGLGNSKNKFNTNFTELHFKFSHHDLMNRDIGFEPFSQLNFPNFTFRLIEDQDLELKKVEIVSLVSLNPMTFLERKTSWGVLFDHRKADNLNCSKSCSSTRLQFSRGWTFALSKKWWVYAMGVLNTEIGSGFSRGYFLGPQVTLSTIFEISKRYKSHIALHGLGRLLPKGLDYAQTELEWKHSYYLGKDWDIQASLHIFKAENSNFTDFQELKAGMNFYF